jgi:hypothetical protein
VGSRWTAGQGPLAQKTPTLPTHPLAQKTPTLPKLTCADANDIDCEVVLGGITLR